MAHINLRPLWAVLFSLALAIPSYAQVTIWSEDFSGYPPGTMNAPGLWTSTGTDCDDPGLNIGNQFGVFGGQFVVNEVEGPLLFAGRRRQRQQFRNRAHQYFRVLYR